MLMLVMIFIVTTGYFCRELWTKTLQTIELARLVEDLEAELDEAHNRADAEEFMRRFIEANKN